MPQLNPSPWFLIFLFAWTFFLVIMPGKIMAHLLNNNPTQKEAQKSKVAAWNWPWS